MLNKILKKGLLLASLAFISLVVSCGDIHAMNYKNYGYYICGMYFVSDDTITEPTFKDNNPKAYVNFANYENNGVIGVGTSSGLDKGWVNFTNTSRTYNLNSKNIMEVYANAVMVFMNYTESSIVYYPIYYMDGTYTIDSSKPENIGVGKGIYEFKTSFKVNGQKFKVKLNVNLKINSEE